METAAADHLIGEKPVEAGLRSLRRPPGHGTVIADQEHRLVFMKQDIAELPIAASWNGKPAGRRFAHRGRGSRSPDRCRSGTRRDAPVDRQHDDTAAHPPTSAAVAQLPCILLRRDSSRNQVHRAERRQQQENLRSTARCSDIPYARSADGAQVDDGRRHQRLVPPPSGDQQQWDDEQRPPPALDQVEHIAQRLPTPAIARIFPSAMLSR